MRRVLAAAFLLLLAVAALPANPKIHTFESGGSRGWIKFWGNAEVSFKGRGSLLIKNLSRVTVKMDGTWGQKQDIADGVQYYHFEGSGTIVGRGIVIELRGWDLALSATGQGEAWLQGDGTYTLDGESGKWDDRAKENKFKKLKFRK